MELKGEQLIPASQRRTWDSLNDPEVLKGCIPGCDTLERTEDGGFTATMALRIGPVSAKFKGKLTLSDVQAPNRYTMHFDGQGGMAGFGKGSAQVELTPGEGGTRLSYAATAQVGGKLAQVGSRLVDAAAAKITNDFFAAFNARVQADAGAAGEAVPAAADVGLGTEARADSGGSQAADTAAPQAGGRSLPSTAWWVGAAALAVLAYLALSG